MAYQTYITEAFVCGSSNRNTADKVFFLFTRGAGMVIASARSVRTERSKQRYALQEFSHIRASLVSGKAGWRIAGVESFENFYFDAKDREVRSFVRNSARLIRRVLRGEENHQKLFDDFILTLKEGNEHDPKKLELTLSLRILYELGYVSPEGPHGHLLSPSGSVDVAKKLSIQDAIFCKKTIDESLLHSQL